MLETPHAVVGAAIAVKVVNPYLAIPLAFASHFILERVPHWNPHLNSELKKYGTVSTQSSAIVVFDVLLSLTLGSFIAYSQLPNNALALTVLLSCFAAVLPDVIEGPYYFLKQKSKFIEKWIKFQKSIQEDTSLIPGLITQTLTIFAAFWWIFG